MLPFSLSLPLAAVNIQRVGSVTGTCNTSLGYDLVEWALLGCSICVQQLGEDFPMPSHALPVPHSTHVQSP